MTAIFEPIHHTLLEVVEYFKQIEVIESAKKVREPQKAKKDKSGKRSDPRLNLTKMARRKILRKRERVRNLPVMRMNTRNSVFIVKK